MAQMGHSLLQVQTTRSGHFAGAGAAVWVNMDRPAPQDPANEPEVDELADESEAESLFADGGSAAGDSVASTEAIAPAPATKGGGRGRGRGGGRGAGRGGEDGAAPAAAQAAAVGGDLTSAVVKALQVAGLKEHLAAKGLDTKGKKAELVARLLAAIGTPPADAQAEEAPAGTAPKYKWVNVETFVFSPRKPFTGEELPKLGPEYNHLTVKSEPYQWFQMRDAPDEEYYERAANSENYRSWRAARGLDGKNKAGANRKSYGNAAEITYADMRTLDAYILLGGLDPAVSRAKVHDGNRLAIIGHRGAGTSV